MQNLAAAPNPRQFVQFVAAGLPGGGRVCAGSALRWALGAAMCAAGRALSDVRSAAAPRWLGSARLGSARPGPQVGTAPLRS